MQSIKTINFSKVIIAVLFISQLCVSNHITAQSILTYNNSFAVEKHSGGIDTADIDGDGDLDILYSGDHGAGVAGQISLHLYKNDGTGNFTEVTPTSLSGILQGDIKFADVDGDNDQDVLIVGLTIDHVNSVFGNLARLYLNDGAGNFTYKSNPFTTNRDCEIAFADVDGDNDQDVCIVGRQGSALYLNDGVGNFSVSTTFSNLAYGRVAFGDINGDNHKDLLIAGQNSSNVNVTELYTNNGSGVFTLVNGTPFTGVNNGQLLIKDIDGDNDNDILVTGFNSDNTAFTGLYFNDGTGNFTLDNNTAFIGYNIGAGAIENIGGRSALIEDFDGDNDMDILIGSGNPTPLYGETRMYLNDGSNKFHAMNNIWMNGHDIDDIAYGDIDGDGIKDFIANGAVSSGGSFTQWWKNTHLTKNNKAIDFSGIDSLVAQHLEVLNTTPLETVPITVEFWAKIPTTDTDIGLIKKTDATKGGFEIYTTSGTLHATYNKDASNHVAVQSSSTINDDAWHHIAFTVDNSNAMLYIDGVLINTSAWTGTAGDATTTENLIFGEGTNSYNGLLDEMRIWNTARTVSQIRENMYNEFTKPTDETTLVANYTMDVYSDSLIMDVSQYYNRAATSGGSIALVDELVNYSNATSNTSTGIQNATATIGKITFDDETANGNNAYDAPIQIVVTEVTGAPNVTTGIMEANIDSRYYIVKSFDGAGTFAADVSIDCAGCTEGQSVSLYGRNHHSTGSWALFTIGTVTGGKAVFQNIPFFSQMIIASAVSLPVELLSFKATAENNHVRLDWSVGIEENLSHYEIEKSENGVDFFNIGSVSARGLSFYKFEDYDIIQNGNYYYRLKTVDFDGSFEYSNIVQLETQNSQSKYRIFPNPVSDILNIEITEPLLIQIINADGQVLKTQEINSTSTISVEDLPNGIYFLRVGKAIQKVMIQH